MVTRSLRPARGLRAAELAPSRLPQLPDVPTATEAGLPGIDGSVRHGSSVPAGTPREIVLKLDDAAQEALADKEVIAGLANKNALVIEGGLPERLAAVIHDDLARWSRMVKMTGFKPEIGAVLSRRQPRHRACRAARSGRCRP